MKKRENKTLYVVIIIALILSVIIFTESFLYFNDSSNFLFKLLLSIENTIKTFVFETTISIQDAIEFKNKSENIWINTITDIYIFVSIIAPCLTFTVLWKIVEEIFCVRLFNHNFVKRKSIVIFGYNNDTEALLNDKYRNRKIDVHLVAHDIPLDVQKSLVHRGVLIHEIDYAQLTDKENALFLKKISIPLAEKILLFEETSSQNFALYTMFHKEENMVKLNHNVKFFLKCDNEGMKRIIEDYYDTPIRKYKNDKEHHAEVYDDMELISISELKVRKMLCDYPLHSFYMNSDIASADLGKWTLHMLVVGFGSMGQQFVLQAMNLGVINSSNKIIIDVFDLNMEENKNIFLSNFADSYIIDEGDRITIPSDKADGYFEIRFHQSDVRYKQFEDELKQYMDENSGIYTYAAICTTDMDVTLDCLNKVEKVISAETADKSYENIVIAVRMENNSHMSKYLNYNEDTFKNVHVIDETAKAITLNDFIDDVFTKETKEFDKIYNCISIVSGPEKQTEDNWKKLELFRKNSNRATAYHFNIKEQTIFKKFDNLNMDELFGTEGKILKNVSDQYMVSDDSILLNEIKNNYPEILEAMKSEHRRWCYFMASIGWSCTDDLKSEKDEQKRKTPCMCTWDDLFDNQMRYCKFDLIPLIKKYEDELQQKN